MTCSQLADCDCRWSAQPKKHCSIKSCDFNELNSEHLALFFSLSFFPFCSQQATDSDSRQGSYPSRSLTTDRKSLACHQNSEPREIGIKYKGSALLLMCQTLYSELAPSESSQLTQTDESQDRKFASFPNSVKLFSPSFFFFFLLTSCLCALLPLYTFSSFPLNIPPPLFSKCSFVSILPECKAANIGSSHQGV